MPDLSAPLPPAERASDPNRTDLLLASNTSPGNSGVGAPDTLTNDVITTPAPVLPSQVARYLVERELAHGGMGEILAAHDPLMGRAVALKVLLAQHRDKPNYRTRLLDEARITGRLQHPGTVAVYDLGELPDTRPFFAMTLVEGETLDAQLAARKTPAENLPHVLSVFERVCQALAYAHAHGVIHRDIKPLNVMVAPFGVVKLMDWGVACEVNGACKPCSSDAQEVLGTPAYMSPEQAQGDPTRVDERADVFGLGGILCAMLTGAPPYPGDSTRKVFSRAQRADLAEAYARLDAAGRAGAPADLVSLAKRCLAPHRDTRPRNAQEVAAALTAYIDSDLRRAERDLVRFFELSPDLFCIAGLDGYFRRVNGNFTRVLGYTPEQLVSRPFVEFVHPDDRESTEAEAEKLSRGLPVVRFRNRYRDTRGAYRWFEWEAKSIPEEGIIFAVARVSQE
ncbi:MAG: PAS domain S-box protein [Planctomycetes bacterium]|nr:PAS domain S-box protein [Planctomycetota bacterium]